MILNESFYAWDNLFKKCLTDLKEKYPKLNDGQLAKIVGIPRATFNRMKNEDKIPQLDNMIKVLIGSDNIDLITHAVELVETGLGQKLKSALENSLNEKEITAENDRLESIFENRDVFIAYLLCNRKNGASADEILNVLGEVGLNAINTLIEKEIAFQMNERFHLKKPGILVRSFKSIKYHLNTYSKYYQTENVGTKTNYAHSLSEGLNHEGLIATHVAHKKFHEELQKIYRNEKYQGDIPAFSVAFCDSFIKSNATKSVGGIN